ncbi:hypothetical protein D1007_54759 [Hordeum vulgare]|nr:hypothetical protein D1007_54759 [Hordeum vulgare]
MGSPSLEGPEYPGALELELASAGGLFGSLSNQGRCAFHLFADIRELTLGNGMCLREVESQQVALDAHAIPEGKLSNICKQVKGASSQVGEASEEAARACNLQLERSRMFRSLEQRAPHALSDTGGEGVSGPLIPDDSGYLGFFYRVVEHFETSAEKALALAEEKSRDLLGQAALDVFSHLLRLDPDFDFASVLDLVRETIRAALPEWVEVHLEDLVTRLAPEGRGMCSDDDESS